MNAQELKSEIQSMLAVESLPVAVDVEDHSDDGLCKISYRWMMPDGRIAMCAKIMHTGDINEYYGGMLPQDLREAIVSNVRYQVEASLGSNDGRQANIITYIEPDGTATDHYPSDPPMIRNQGEGEWISSAQAERTYKLVSGVVRNYAARHPELVGDVFQKVDGRTWMVKREWADEKWGKSWKKRYALVEEIHDKGYMTDAKWRRQQSV